MKKDVKCLLSALVFAGISWGGYGIASAAGEAVYELNPVVVTATRTEKMDVDVPATTTVITAKDIQDKGYVSVFDALEHTVGVDSYNYSAGGGDDLGGSQSRFYIRGMDKGTLVLVNGAPINVMNYSSTEGVPVDAVENRNGVVIGHPQVLGFLPLHFHGEVKNVLRLFLEGQEEISPDPGLAAVNARPWSRKSWPLGQLQQGEH